jgi:hypothetical protein
MFSEDTDEFPSSFDRPEAWPNYWGQQNTRFRFLVFLRTVIVGTLAQKSFQHATRFLMWTGLSSPGQCPKHERPSSASQLSRRLSLTGGCVEVVSGGLLFWRHFTALDYPSPLHIHISHLPISSFSYSNLPYEQVIISNLTSSYCHCEGNYYLFQNHKQNWKVKNAVFLDVTSFDFCMNRCFGGKHSLHHQG